MQHARMSRARYVQEDWTLTGEWNPRAEQDTIPTTGTVPGPRGRADRTQLPQVAVGAGRRLALFTAHRLDLDQRLFGWNSSSTSSIRRRLFMSQSSDPDFQASFRP